MHISSLGIFYSGRMTRLRTPLRTSLTETLGLTTLTVVSTSVDTLLYHGSQMQYSAQL